MVSTQGPDLTSLVGLVKKLGICQPDETPVIENLGGGISNLVARVRTPKGTWVVKQSLGQLRVKDEWLASRGRILIEAECLRTIRELVTDRPAPDVVKVDAEDFACVLEYAGDDAQNWKAELMAGVVDEKVTGRVAAILAELHRKTWDSDEIRAKFGDVTNFEQLRLDPYLATVARRHPDLEAQVEDVIALLRNERHCLVHGDYSPKNLLILGDGRLWVIDCEAAHYGNPAFDIAFCTNHLLLKAMHLRSRMHLDGARRLWSDYWQAVGDEHLEAEAVRTLAALMLARVDGKSPVEYLSDGERKTVRSLSRKLVADREEVFAALVQKVEGAAAET